MEKRRRICVVGAGIIGISSALAVKQAFPHHDVVVQAKDFTPNTTSDGAAGLWRPPRIPNHSPQQQQLSHTWSKATYDYAMELMQDDPMSAHAGITTTHGFSLSNEHLCTPYWSDIPYDFGLLTGDDRGRFPSYVTSGYKYTTVFIECGKFIPWLTGKLRNLGGEIVQKEVRSLEDLSPEFDIVVNCTGMGAKDLVDDAKMTAVRGQVMRVRAPWVKQFIIFENTATNTSTYILPNQDTVVLGGTANVNDTSTKVDDNDTQHILQSCREMLPSLAHAQHQGHWVGLRPGRSDVRLEREDLVTTSNKVLKVVHNYGHGGKGITLHRGCALDVVNYVEQCLYELSDRVKSKM